MASLQDLLAQRAEIEQKITEAQREERGAAIAQVRALMAKFGLTAADIAGRTATGRAKSSRSPVAPKYRDKRTGDTWSGRGLQPKWLRAALTAGRKIEEFVI